MPEPVRSEPTHHRGGVWQVSERNIQALSKVAKCIALELLPWPLC
jgi:hypothetical protein